MNRKTTSKALPVVARKVEPAVGHLPATFDPFSALYRVSLSCQIARDALEGKTRPETHWSVTPSEYALFNLCHAIEDLSKAVAFFNQPNPKVERREASDAQ